MSRYAAMFDRLRREQAGAFGGFLMLGDPDLETSARLLDALVEGGADMIEVGIPFSDPVADGPVIQAASVRALGAGARTADGLALLADFRARHPDIPVGILAYANLVVARGIDAFCRSCADAGVDSLLVADVPVREAERFVAAARAHEVAPVLIAAANTPPHAIRSIARMSDGYVYCVSRSGVTGDDRAIALDHDRLFAALAAAGAPPPVLGFGIAAPSDVRAALDAGAAGVICGSAIVRLTERPGGRVERVRQFVRSMKAATIAPARAALSEARGLRL